MKEFLFYLISCFTVLVLIFILAICRGYRQAGGDIRNRIKYKGERIKKPNYIKMILWDFPKQIGKDISHRNPNDFRYKGVIVFEGEQGSGKTSSLVKFAKDILKEYPDAVIASNIKVKGQKQGVETARDILKTNNGTSGVCLVVDECQQFYNSKNSLNLDSSVTGAVTTLRKTRRVLLATCQQFYMLSKDIRTQTSLLIQCHCVMGALNICIKKKPIFDSSGEIKKMKFKGFYMFVQDEELRESYDTEEIVKALDKYGLKEKIERE